MSIPENFPLWLGAGGAIFYLLFNVVTHSRLGGLLFGGGAKTEVGQVRGVASDGQRTTVVVHRLSNPTATRAAAIDFRWAQPLGFGGGGTVLSRDDVRAIADALDTAAAEAESQQ